MSPDARGITGFYCIYNSGRWTKSKNSVILNMFYMFSGSQLWLNHTCPANPWKVHVQYYFISAAHYLFFIIPYIKKGNQYP
jgi:hypothetical protein